MEWYLKVVRDNYANFEGRARRKEYWMFTLFQIIIIFILALLGGLLGGASESVLGMLPLGIYALATFIPGIAVTVRRLHDTNKSGWYYLLSFIPYIGGIIMIILTVIEGDRGPNKYGPDPKNPLNEEINEIGKSFE
ncbi:DUF805 domain-containing protein [Mesoflavibacter sp. SCSIO 43206]|uniref:DUF805 domain-containing protein n=1 Tax=Mesoflavibacter sp. SCSIO 43206 TaxID=2779362 RepID=UPI001CA9E570|nr:DUF805 domain-containing protein [Mesoflavibacter sp. SCSIO 43206]UAB75860.1 DUF805 domain-containing protein [Mesoflavibacter sp. SCSIO 43206]